MRHFRGFLLSPELLCAEEIDMKTSLLCFLLFLLPLAHAAKSKEKSVERTVAAQGQYECAIRNLSSGTTYPFAQVKRFLNERCDPDKPFSITAGAPNSYLVCCVSR